MPLWMAGEKKVHFISLGCPRNLVDTEVMLGILLKSGYAVTDKPQEADYLVVNTCSFLEASRQESKETIEQLFEVKKEEAKVIVAGCMVTKHRKEVEQLFPKVHYFLGSGDVEGILKAVEADEPGRCIGLAKSYLESGEVPRVVSTPKHYAYLKIAEGCRKACAYCSIPQIKGPLRSKSPEQVVKEFQTLVKGGAKEIILIAQDLGDYGKDRGERSGALVPLLKKILEIPGETWIRLLYLYPDEITEELIELMRSDRRICPYIDMPIQHINDEILKAMRRHTTGEEIRKTLRRLKERIPDMHIRTSLIVGFPGETDAQFEELLAFVKSGELHHIGIFKYSREEGTPAGRREDQVPEAIKEKRHLRLVKAQQKVVAKWQRELVGKTLEVVVDGVHPESHHLLVGRTQGLCPDIDGVVILNDARGVKRFGERYPVEIVDVAGYDLIGRVKIGEKASKLALL